MSTISRKLLKKILEKNLNPSKALYFPNWVDTSEIFPIENSRKNSYKKRLEISDEKIIFMYSGSMNEKQGIELLARLASHQFSNKNILWIFSGDGPSKSKLISKTKNLENVIIYPLQPASKINEWLNQLSFNLESCSINKYKPLRNYTLESLEDMEKNLEFLSIEENVEKLSFNPGYFTICAKRKDSNV